MSPLPSKPADRRFRILIVEDDPTTARLVALSLKQAGHAIFVARDGLEAWNQLPQINPHLLLTDINMPSLCGYELTKRVRDVSLIPIVLMTAQDSEQAQTQGFNVGADDYLAKPFNPQLLNARVATSLRRVYHYNGPSSHAGLRLMAHSQKAQNPVSEPASEQTAPGLPAGFVRCDSCDYMGPAWKFEKRSDAGNLSMQCPVCPNTNITFALA